MITMTLPTLQDHRNLFIARFNLQLIVASVPFNKKLKTVFILIHFLQKSEKNIVNGFFNYAIIENCFLPKY